MGHGPVVKTNFPRMCPLKWGEGGGLKMVYLFFKKNLVQNNIVPLANVLKRGGGV